MRNSFVTDRRFLQVLRLMPGVAIQNRLMACDDRNIAVCILYYTQEERDEVLSHIHPKKAQRVREEYIFLKRRNVQNSDHRQITNHIIARIKGGEQTLPLSSYRKPIG